MTSNRSHYNEQNFMVSPVKGLSDIEESAPGEPKKSRNRHLVMINQLRKKEEQWDGRFYLQHIPKYHFIEDEHCETYKKMLFKKKTRKFVLRKETKGQTFLEMGAARKPMEERSLETHYKRPESTDKPPMDIRSRAMFPGDIKAREKIRPESLRKNSQNTEVLLKEKKLQQDRLLSTWDRLSIPLFHREVFVKCENLQNLKKTVELIKREIDEVETNCSCIQLAIKAVAARENCLKQIRGLIQKLYQSGTSEPQNEEELKQKASELLTHLRIISLNVVETIMKWREYIQQAYYSTRSVLKGNKTMQVVFIYNQENYLIKMKNDTKDFNTTPLAKYFTFSSKYDPFLIEPSKETEQKDKLVLFVSKGLLSRIKSCDHVLENEVLESQLEKSNQLRSLDSPSDRSLNKQEEQKKPAIKIRNTSLARPKKELPHKEPVKHDHVTLGHSPSGQHSHPSSINQVTDGDTEKIASVSEYKTEVNSLAKQEQHSQSPQSNQHKSTADKGASFKDIKPETKQDTKPEIKTETKPDVKSEVKHEVKPEIKAEAKLETKPEVKAEVKHETDVKLPEKTEKQEAEISVRPIDLYEDEMEEFMKNYLANVDRSMKDSFLSDPKGLIERANMGQDPIWFELVQSGEKVGVAVAHIDNSVFTTRRMVILHFSSVVRDTYQDFLGKFVEYLWTHDECAEIKICLYHIEDQNGNLGADKNLEQSIKKLGFRWKQLTNDKYTGKRYIDYLIKRPENIVCSGAKVNDEPIHVQSIVVLSDLQGENSVNKAPKFPIDMFDNRYAILSAALKHCDEKLDKLGDSETKRNKNYLQVIGTLIKEGQGKIGDLTGKFQNLQEMETFVSEKFKDKAELIPHIDAKHSKNIFTTSLLNLIYRWKSFNITHHKVAGKDRKYLKINNNGDLVQFQSKHKGSSIYFLPTDDNEVNVFITDNEAIVKDILSKEEIIEDVVSKLFSKLEKTPTPFKEDLWVPLFAMKDMNVDLEDAKALLKGDCKLNYAVNTCDIGLNGSRVAGNLKVRPSEKSKIIDKPFLFGILHEQVDFPLFSVVVQPEDFIETNN